MMEEARLTPAKVDSAAIGFVLGPRLNAAGRLATAETSYKLLTAPDPLTARPFAEELGRLNLERQRLTQEMMAQAKAQIEASPGSGYLFLVSHASFNPGVVGLVAGRLTEEYYRPALVAHAGPEEAHGSARSIAEFNITEALDECRDLLRRYGGHAAAAGFTVANEKVPLLQARLDAIAGRKLAGRELAPSLSVDAVIELDDIDWALHGLLAQLEPCGYANPQPLFATTGLEAAWPPRTVGHDGQHLKLAVRDPNGIGPNARRVLDAIAFRLGGWAGQLPRRFDLAYTVEANEFNGERRLQLNVRDIRPAAQ
jgi:single-stranded-DNA-specific exonuclease